MTNDKQSPMVRKLWTLLCHFVLGRHCMLQVGCYKLMNCHEIHPLLMLIDQINVSNKIVLEFIKFVSGDMIELNIILKI